MVEGARLLSEYTVKSCIEGSNPFLSAKFRVKQSPQGKDTSGENSIEPGDGPSFVLDRRWEMKGVDTIAQIRRAPLVRGRTITENVPEQHVSRNTVRKVLCPGATEFGYEREARTLPKLGR